MKEPDLPQGQPIYRKLFRLDGPMADDDWARLVAHFFRDNELVIEYFGHILDEVAFVIVGGFAARLHGAARMTGDVDICPARQDKNLLRLSRALLKLDAAMRLRPELGPVIVRPNSRLLEQFRASLWRTSAGAVDVLLGISASRNRLIGFAELAERSVELSLRDGTILVAALEDVIRSKEIADRPKDREALPELRALLEARRARLALELQAHAIAVLGDRPAGVTGPGQSRRPLEREGLDLGR